MVLELGVHKRFYFGVERDQIDPFSYLVFDLVVLYFKL